MFSTKSLLAVASAMFIGSASAFTGTASLNFTTSTVNCGCPPTNGPSQVAIPAALVGTHVCCQAPEINISYNGKTVAAVFSGVYTAGAGTDNIELSQFAFGILEDNASQTSLSPVTWAFST
ncbi:hypothetical protein C8R46DRAFT_1220844 [Mycena filopes]|nr:hypothetical protein C8R46DRAFT_1220844 [Mycena filopes]